MKKAIRLVVALLVSAMLLSFVGCDKNSDGDEREEVIRHSGSETIESRTSESETTNEAVVSGQKWNLGSVTKTGLDNGYTDNKAVDKNDPHYGWSLGQFYVSGYTQRKSDSKNGDVFLKNVGDKVELHFELLQDIDKLNGNDNLIVNYDRNGYDRYFATQQFNDCRGLLIVRKTDYQNNTEDPVIYTNYLDGVKQGADTVVEFCEEGDYEVALDYELKLNHYGTEWNDKVSVPTYTNYRIYFTFKIRNGNCMVFPFDTETGSELTNEAFTDNGFYLDLANSRYLEINVKRSVFVEKAGDFTEDVRFNRPAADGAQYTDEGVYTITVKNLYTSQETTKVIYVGKDPIMRAYVVTGYSPKEIKKMLEKGYTISDSGELIEPQAQETTKPTNSTTVATTTTTTTTIATTTTEETKSTGENNSSEETSVESRETNDTKTTNSEETITTESGSTGE